jgi:hypothetical protein
MEAAFVARNRKDIDSRSPQFNSIDLLFSDTVDQCHQLGHVSSQHVSRNIVHL